MTRYISSRFADPRDRFVGGFPYIYWSIEIGMEEGIFLTVTYTHCYVTTERHFGSRVADILTLLLTHITPLLPPMTLLPVCQSAADTSLTLASIWLMDRNREVAFYNSGYHMYHLL